MLTTPVSLVRCESYESAALDAALDESLAGLGGLGRFVAPGQKVLIKPNCIAPASPQQAAATDPAVILAVARRVRRLGAEPMVGDSPAWGRLGDNLARLGLVAPLAEVGCKVVSFRRSVRVRNQPMRLFKHFRIAPEVLAADVVINLPKLKGHCQLALTAAVKNMFGCTPGKRKAWMHFSLTHRPEAFCCMLVELFDRIRPALTIVDGVLGQEGDGPIHGRPRRFGWLIAGGDGFAVERVCAELVGYRPDELPILSAAERLGIGQCDLERIEVVGRSIESMRIADFRRPDMMPIRFPLLRVVRSTIKNLLLFRPRRGHSRN